MRKRTLRFFSRQFTMLLLVSLRCTIFAFSGFDFSVSQLYTLIYIRFDMLPLWYAAYRNGILLGKWRRIRVDVLVGIACVHTSLGAETTVIIWECRSRFLTSGAKIAWWKIWTSRIAINLCYLQEFIQDLSSISKLTFQIFLVFMA